MILGPPFLFFPTVTVLSHFRLYIPSLDIPWPVTLALSSGIPQENLSNDVFFDSGLFQHAADPLPFFLPIVLTTGSCIIGFSRWFSFISGHHILKMHLMYQSINAWTFHST